MALERLFLFSLVEGVAYIVFRVGFHFIVLDGLQIHALLF